MNKFVQPLALKVSSAGMGNCSKVFISSEKGLQIGVDCCLSDCPEIDLPENLKTKLEIAQYFIWQLQIILKDNCQIKLEGNLIVLSKVLSYSYDDDLVVMKKIALAAL